MRGVRCVRGVRAYPTVRGQTPTLAEAVSEAGPLARQNSDVSFRDPLTVTLLQSKIAQMYMCATRDREGRQSGARISQRGAFKSGIWEDLGLFAASGPHFEKLGHPSSAQIRQK